MFKALKKVLICTCSLAFLLTVPASAFKQNLDLHYSYDGTRVNFANTFSTDCYSMSYVSAMQVNMYVYAETTGTVLCDQYNNQENPTSDHVVSSWSKRNIPQGNYVNEGAGIIKYYSPFEFQNDIQESKRVFTHSLRQSSADVNIPTSTSNRSILNRGIEILDTFGVDAGSYTQIANSDLKKHIDIEDYLSIKQDLSLSFGDTIPVYFLNEDASFLIAVKQDASGINHKYEFASDAEGHWTLCGTPATKEASTFYSSNFLAECVAAESLER